MNILATEVFLKQKSFPAEIFFKAFIITILYDHNSNLSVKVILE